MKLKINDKYVEVNFWSFLKCALIVNIATTAILYGSIAVITIASQILR